MWHELARNGDSAVQLQTEEPMRIALGSFGILAALIATDASAQVQGVNLNGTYRCVSACLGAPGSLAFITQNGRQLNVVNDAGIPSRAWVD